MSHRERGQIILIAAFTLAVTFVALALVINSAIFTENLASRGQTSGSSQALYYQHEVRTGVGATIAYANVYNHSGLSPLTGLSDTVEEGVEDLARLGSTQQAIGGQVVDVEFVGTTPGTRLADNESGGSTFESGGATPVANWMLAERVDDTRNVVINITDPSVLHDGVADDAFRVELNNTGLPDRDWNVSIRRSGPLPADVIVETETPAGDVADCRIPVSSGETLRVDVTGAVVGGEHCPALDGLPASGSDMSWPNSMSPYNISFENGDEIQGNYSMVIKPRGAHNPPGNFNSFVTGPPYQTDAIYSARVEYVYRTADVAYEAVLEVAPGDPDD